MDINSNVGKSKIDNIIRWTSYTQEGGGDSSDDVLLPFFSLIK